MRMRIACLAVAALALAACTSQREAAERREEEVARRVAEAEGAEGAPSNEATGAVTRPPAGITPAGVGSAPPAPVEPPTPQMLAWAAALDRSIDTLDRRSRQALAVSRLRAAGDPRQKSQELLASMQWCEEGALEACLHVGHVLLFNECLLDRARGFYERAATLSADLPAQVEWFPVDGQPPRQELNSGLQFSDPARREDQQVQSLLAVCGAIAARDRPHWDALFASQAAGETTPAVEPASAEERLALGVIHKKMLLETNERVAALLGLHAGLAGGVRDRLARAASEMCSGGDPGSCATASFLHAGRCDFAAMQEAFQRFEAAVALDPATRPRWLELSGDVLGLARADARGDLRVREQLRRSCAAR
jgi:hypothetical protein